MGKIAIATTEEARIVEPPAEASGQVEVRALLDSDADPLHAHLHRLGSGASLRLGPAPVDCIGYVWQGAVEAGGRRLAAGSSFIVEHAASLEVRGGEEGAVIIAFQAAKPTPSPRAGGHVHLLPAEQAPRAELGPGLAGGLHADASLPTCELWLHENSMAPAAPEPMGAASEKGVHSHTEDEVIFVTEGQMRLGQRLYGPGSAIAIPAHTLYSFGVGPEGLKFINFRAGRPDVIRFKTGGTMDEVGYWRERMGSPQYLSPVASSA